MNKMFSSKLPERTVERLSKYRRMLLLLEKEKKAQVYSHELAALMHISPEQVRRDMMLIGYTGRQSKGYDIHELNEFIGSIIDNPQGHKIIMVGMGNLGKAIASYFIGKHTQLSIVAAFDVDSEKINRVNAGIHCYHVEKMAEIIKKENVAIAVLAVPSEVATTIANQCIIAGIKGILNFTSVPLHVPEHVFLEEYDILASLEKVSYFSK